MKEYIPILRQTSMFAGLGDGDIASMLTCLDARLRTYKKGEYIVRQGEHLRDIMVLVDGALHLQTDDYWGNRSILSHIAPGEMFGESYATPESGPLLTNVIAIQDSAVIFFDVTRLMTTCSAACRFHSLVIQNIYFAISQKNRGLVQKLGYMSKRTTREKLLAYLSDQAKKHNGSSFDIPFNRQQLADFLSVDRSAMSNELCKMRDEGMIRFEKNHFTLIHSDI